MNPEYERSGPQAGRSTPGPSESDFEQALRRRAEALAAQRTDELPEDWEELSPEAARRVLHELRVHQIELEMQNEELRRIQGELETSRARYFDLYDLAPVGYFTLNEEGLILEANLTAAKLLGVPRGDLVKQPLSKFILPEDQDSHYLRRKQLTEAGAPQSWELRLLRKDSEPFWARVEATIAQDADGAPVWRVVVSDITESKRAEEEKATLEAQNRQLQKLEGLGRMAGAIAHKFNNILTVVMGNLELAIGGLPKVGGPVEQLTNALRAARDASEISKLCPASAGNGESVPPLR
jgi:two-component system cell cycle sensor histidine kinase/response regulator CckA